MNLQVKNDSSLWILGSILCFLAFLYFCKWPEWGYPPLQKKSSVSVSIFSEYTKLGLHPIGIFVPMGIQLKEALKCPIISKL